MKTLTIRLNEEDLKNIEELRIHTKTPAISKNIKFALRKVAEYFELKETVDKAIQSQYVIKQKDLKELKSLVRW